MSRAERVTIWRNSDLLKILAGEMVSDFGSQIGELALPLVAAVALGASAGQMASLLAAAYVPRIVMGLAAAGWIDRVRRRPVLIATNMARFAILAAVALAALRHALSIEILYGVGLTLAALDVLFTSTFAAYLPTLVPTSMLIAANGARATSSAGAGVLGPAVAGTLISALGAPLAIFFDGLSFLASVVGMTSVGRPEPPPHQAIRQQHTARLIADGWSALLQQPVLRSFAATAFTANFFYRIVMAAYVLYLTRDLSLSPATVGAIFGLGGGLGVPMGSALAAPVARIFGVGRTMIAAHVLFGVFGIPLAVTTFVPVYGAALVFTSELLQLAVNEIYMVNRTSVEQALSSPELPRPYSDEQDRRPRAGRRTGPDSRRFARRRSEYRCCDRHRSAWRFNELHLAAGKPTSPRAPAGTHMLTRVLAVNDRTSAGSPSGSTFQPATACEPCNSAVEHLLECHKELGSSPE